MIPLTRRDLDAQTCMDPTCDHTAHQGGLVVHSACHPRTPTWCAYADGVLTIECSLCHRVIVRIAVASPPETRH